MALWPTTPLPPVRLTTFTGWPSSFSSNDPMMRAVASVPPPAAQGTSKVMGRSGQSARAGFAPARSGALIPKRAIAKTNLQNRRRIMFPLLGCGAPPSARAYQVRKRTHQILYDQIRFPSRFRACGRHLETERFGGLEVDDELVCCRCLHRHVCRLLALQDAIDIAGRAAVIVDRVG